MEEWMKVSYQTLRLILWAYPLTLLLSALSLLGAIVFGFGIALLKNSHNFFLRTVGTLYVNVFRNIPYIILVFVVFYGVPMIFDYQISALAVAVVSLSLNQAAYFGEIIRGGLAKLEVAQIEGGEALALSRWQQFRLIIFPQVMYMVTPALMGQTTQLIKSTPVVSVIGIRELTGMGKAAVVSTHQPLLCFFWVALFYFITCYFLQIVAQKMEKKNLRIMRGTRS